MKRDEALHAWVQDGLKKGYSREQLAVHLAQTGYTNEQIDVILKPDPVVQTPVIPHASGAHRWLLIGAIACFVLAVVAGGMLIYTSIQPTQTFEASSEEAGATIGVIIETETSPVEESLAT